MTIEDATDWLENNPEIPPGDILDMRRYSVLGSAGFMRIGPVLCNMSHADIARWCDVTGDCL